MTRRDLVRSLPLAALSAVSLHASSPTTVITVKVTNQYGKPVENAYIILDFLGSHQLTKLGKREKLHWEVRSNLQGSAHFPSIRQGKIRVQVIATNYQTFGEVYDIAETEKTVEVQLKPPQKQYSVHGDAPVKKTDDKPPADKPKDPPQQ